MSASDGPYAITGPMSPALDGVLARWRELLRGGAEMPFWDDLDLATFRACCPGVFLLDVFEKPQRFRLALAEVGLSQDAQDHVLGRFIDEVDLPAPFEMLRSQCCATAELAAPTLYRHGGAQGGYARLVLPAWGEGQIHMLLGAVDAQ
jgi:hypothetical protein